MAKLLACILATILTTSMSIAGPVSNQECDNECKIQRLTSCCSAFIKDPTCMKLCRFDTSSDELAERGIRCKDSLKYWAYCASDGNDNTECCKANSVSSDCFPWCRGDAPAICQSNRSQLSQFVVCTNQIGKILQCHKSRLGASASYNPQKFFAPEPPCPN